MERYFSLTPAPKDLVTVVRDFLEQPICYYNDQQLNPVVTRRKVSLRTTKPRHSAPLPVFGDFSTRTNAWCGA